VDSLQIHEAQVFEQRFHGKEANVGIHLAEMVDAGQSIAAVLYRDPEPYIGRAGSVREIAWQAFGPLGENLVSSPKSSVRRRDHASSGGPCLGSIRITLDEGNSIHRSTFRVAASFSIVGHCTCIP
jgi:hypothetical protein